MRLELYESIIEFGLDGENHKPLSNISSMVFEAFKPKLSRDYNRYGVMCERNKANGLKGGRPKSETQETEKTQWVIEKPKKPSGLLEKPKNPENHDNDNEYDNDNDLILEDKSSLSQSDIEHIKFFFNESVKNGTIPKITCIKGQRLNSLKARFKEHGLDNIKQAIINAATSGFLNGKNNHSFIATFDWIFRPNNFVKVFEGNYNDRNKEYSADNNGGKAYEIGVNLQERIFARMEQEEAGAD